MRLLYEPHQSEYSQRLLHLGWQGYPADLKSARWQKHICAQSGAYVRLTSHNQLDCRQLPGKNFLKLFWQFVHDGLHKETCAV